MIHKEGIRIITILVLILAFVNITSAIILGTGWFLYILITASILILAFVLRFFRNPGRTPTQESDLIYAPADGKVVVVEETNESEYFNDRRIQVSIFMSVWNVHINWYPVAGTVILAKYHPGKYLLARHPKSSVLNERQTLVLRAESGTELLVRQIAGFVARRIISYAIEKKKAELGDELGFIRFGSRVDIFFPPGTEILVSPGQKTKGLITPIARV
jgi:phosphatidylserine decarboxylase